MEDDCRRRHLGRVASRRWRTGNDGVASLVSLVPGSIGYLEYAYALQRLDRISFGIVVQNGAGNFVVPDAASFQAAASSADWTAERDFHLVLTNAPGEDAYPITATLRGDAEAPKSPERSAAAIDFVRWSLESGRPQAETLNYVPLPPALVEQVELYWQLSFGPATMTASAGSKR